MPDSPQIIDNLKIRSEVVQEIISTPPSWLIRWGITLVFVIIGLVILLSFLIEYPDLIQAKVIVTTLEPTERVIPRRSGQIDRILVSNGERVIPGQVLASFKGSGRPEEILFLKDVLDSVPFDGANSFEFPIDLTTGLKLGEIESAYVEFERDYMEFKLLPTDQPNSEQLEGSMVSLMRVHERLKSNLAQKKLLDRKEALACIDFERNRALYEEGVIDAVDFDAKEAEYLQLLEQMDSNAVSITQSQVSLVKADHGFRSARITGEQKEVIVLTSLLRSYHGLNRAVSEWEYRYILSSFNGGIVGFMKVEIANQLVAAGDHVFSVFPERRSDLVGKMMITSQNAEKIENGQRVLVKLDNSPFQQFDTLHGVIKSISASPNEDGYHSVYLSLPRVTKTFQEDDLGLSEGLLGQAEIMTEKSSVADRLFFRFRSLLEYQRGS